VKYFKFNFDYTTLLMQNPIYNEIAFLKIECGGEKRNYLSIT